MLPNTVLDTFVRFSARVLGSAPEYDQDQNMKMMMAVITALGIPLLILNWVGGIASGIWLAVLGEWSVLGMGLVLFFLSTAVLGFVLMPSMLLAARAAYCAERGRTIGLVCFGASTVYRF